MSKTTKIQPPVYASVGAVAQREGSLPVYVCNECQREVVWAESKRTGRKYLANVSRGYLARRFYIGSNVHKHDGIRGPQLHVDDQNDERDDDAEAQYDDFAAEQYASHHNLAIDALGQFVDTTEADAYFATLSDDDKRFAADGWLGFGGA